MARVYVATDDKLLVSAASSAAPVWASWPCASSRSTLLHCGSRGPPDWLGHIATSAQRALTSPSLGRVSSSSGTAGPADPPSLKVLAGSRSEMSSEMKLSLVTFGMRGLGVSMGWSGLSVGASTTDSGEVEVTRQLAPSVDTFSVSNSTSLTTDWARTSPEKKHPALWHRRWERGTELLYYCFPRAHFASHVCWHDSLHWKLEFIIAASSIIRWLWMVPLMSLSHSLTCWLKSL